MDRQRLIITRSERDDPFVEAFGILDLRAPTGQVVDDLRGV